MMSTSSSDASLRTEQYASAANLNARIQLHTRFSTNTYGWYNWLFDQLRFPSPCRIVELGAGPGSFWAENLKRLPPDWTMTLSDFSGGMIVQAQHNLGDPQFSFVVADAQELPFVGQSADVVMANHMLYHVPDRLRALGEIRRVLKPGGALYATTVGAAHMLELDHLLRRFDPAIDMWSGAFGPAYLAFTLENGAEQLAPFFHDVAIHRYPDALAVTEVDPLVDYVLSSGVDLLPERRPDLARFMRKEMVERGRIDITKDSGLFVARL